MWPLRRKGKSREKTIQAAVSAQPDGTTAIDVRGQTCPGYLLAINRAMDAMERGTTAKLLVDYPPCGDDVRAWCDEKGYRFLDFSQEPECWA
ncbi:MAG TPA: sulfurtransferase TusA family protein, partial [Gammaproteobacteria bacterium]|nr:sulfurtransferase TusA family protein [Gammaproteobacteria bacterium]